MVVWSDQVNAKLLITTLQQVTPQVSREVWKKVAETMGSDFTAEACRQNYAKLLKAQGVSTPAATPGPATPVPSTPKSSRKRKDITGIEATPSKSASAKKPKKAQPATAIKTEKYEEQEDELVPPATPFVKKFEDDSD